ncbi:peptidase c14 caspase catalytic subunit p20, putative [Ichthyophthirius multifiliis]|uniref:Peptidase c14 caspase catalytic subunit p20, putative n=1 Tax=Ichthyophthirius multifiliis TaxID=5932 RepID=G0QTS2_ICHMU|nr:peptidase c14 caspase catalytic subunit p20, putative [Ichthyophthirius multifiliis]EGR31393.1 peptidase c14 caspase catalytic subunit p20, putative [Ichthyophthirius multifiliis]|eukprot:XP_004034879.1 peptidase c14 caspase catalytic subunit p20, putative [Ichthyophthirius multifiliis]
MNTNNFIRTQNQYYYDQKAYSNGKKHLKSNSMYLNPDIKDLSDIMTITSSNASPQNSKFQKTRPTINLDNLIEICSKKLEQHSNHKKALYIRSSSYIKKGKYKEAIIDCDTLLKLDKDNVGAYYLRGCAFEKQNLIDQAIEDFTRVLKLDENHVNAAFARAACLNKIGDYNGAIDNYIVALEKDSEKSLNQTNNIKRAFKNSDSSMKISQNNSLLNSQSQKGYELKTPLQQKSENKQQQNIKYYSNGFLLEIQSSKQKYEEESGGLMNPQNDKDNSQFCMINTNNIDNSYLFQQQKSNNTQKQAQNTHHQPKNLQHPSHITEKKQISDWYHQQGFEARKNNELETAIQLYTIALQYNPQHFKAVFNRGFAFDKLKEYDLAIKDYTKALEIENNNCYAYYNRGISYDRKGDFDYAIKDFTKAIALNPQKSDFYHNRGFAWKKKGCFNEAIQDFTFSIQFENDHFKSFYNRAICYEKMGDFQLAENDYLQALSLQPNNTSCINYLAALLDKLNRSIEALEYFNKSLKIDDKQPLVYNGKGLILDKMGKLEEAQQNFSQAIELDRQNPTYVHNRGCCLRSGDKLLEAIKDFENALKLDPNNTVILSNLGLVFRKLEQFENAIQCYNEEIRIGGENVRSLNNRGYSYAKLGKFNEAIQDYSQAVSLQPENTHALHNRGICYEKLGKFQKAIEDFSQVIKQNPLNANAFFNRGCCFDNLGKIDQAIQDYSKALEIDNKQQSNGNQQSNILSEHNYTKLKFQRLTQQTLQDYLDSYCEVCFTTNKKYYPEGEERGLNMMKCFGCQITVHCYCYGLETQTKEEIIGGQKVTYFLCERCQQDQPKKQFNCIICNQKKGAIKKLENNEWVHVTCGLYNSENIVMPKNYLDMSFVKKQSISKKKKQAKQPQCHFCKSSVGILPCCDLNCKQYAHVYCLMIYMNNAEIEKKDSTEYEWYLRMNLLKNSNFSIQNYSQDLSECHIY